MPCNMSKDVCTGLGLGASFNDNGDGNGVEDDDDLASPSSLCVTVFLDPDDLENYFSFRVHHGGEFDGKMENYIGGTISFFDYVSMDELSLLDMDDIAIQLQYRLPVGYWIEVSGYEKPFNIGTDHDLMWFKDKIPHNRVLDLYIEPIQAVQTVIGNELILSQQQESQEHLYSFSDDEEQPTGGVNIGPVGAGVEVGFGGVNIGPVGAGVEVGSGGVNIGAASVEIGSASVVGNIGDELNVESTENEEVVESDYEQEPEDIAANTCVDPTRDWESLQVAVIPHAECGSGSDLDLGSDDLRSLDGSDGEEDDGGPRRKFIKTNYHEFNPRCDLQDPIFRVGMEFGSADLFRKAIRAHAVKHRRVVKFKKNDPNRIKAVCMGEGCQWFVYASWLADHKTFKIKSLVDEHTCVMSFRNKFVNSKMIAEKYVGQWRVNPDWNFAGLSQQLRTDTSVDASVWQYYRARKAARQMIQGSVKEQYSKLWEYGAEIRRMNPGSTVMIKCTEGHGDENPRFERLYMCLVALKKGWKEGCRPILGLDGCFIKGYHTGQLLTAIGVDPNNQMYPVAYALVESECKDTWSWFLKHLTDDLGLNNSYGIVWITDKQKGLIDVIREQFPNSEHRFCVKHLYNNFKTDHKGLLLKQILWGAAKSTTEQGFKHCMERMRIESEDAYKWLADKDPNHWSRAFFKDTALCDMLCNNMCEAFNKAILQARDKPVITLMEMIRNYLMKRLVRKRAEVEKWHHDIGPKVLKFVEKLKLESSICQPDYSGNNKYQVRGLGDEQYVVDIENKTCACNKWQLIGIPCIHGISALSSSNRDPYQFIDIKYKKESFLKAYNPVIYGINGPSMWPKTNDKPIQCPDFKKQRGRPKKSRNLQSDEVRVGGKTKLRRNYVVLRCTKCRQEGHNKSTCDRRAGMVGNASETIARTEVWTGTIHTGT
ncbi:hypothetical protein LWI29_005213 [Acer saccharum]|uniref:SWIM-type domain-containing protein n=1 Tax=Acer saccharum TaxID=4024 RepID=A0AA39S683_ACESA|nr:hypothetical protein LWI29_005213 [Acer saccharum]